MKIYQKLAELIAEREETTSIQKRNKYVADLVWLMETSEMPFSDKIELNLELSNEDYLHFGTIRVRANLRHNFIVEVDYNNDLGATDVDRLFREWLNKEILPKPGDGIYFDYVISALS